MIEAKARDGQTFLISEEDQDLLRFKWRVDRNGYVVRSTSKPAPEPILRFVKKCDCLRWYKSKGAIVKLHRVIAKRMDIIYKATVDHSDRNKLNNQRENLRPASFTLNNRNKATRTSVSGITGVTWDKTKKNYLVRYTDKDKNLNLIKRMPTKEEARNLRQQWEVAYA